MARDTRPDIEMRAPGWWQDRGFRSTALLPLGFAFGLAGAARRRWTSPVSAKVPVVCVGNLVAGGAGKTPVALALACILRELGAAPHFLTRGYGGRAAGPLLVDPERHDYRAVGDEALLLARAAPCWVARDRVAGARAAAAAGADVIVMDDGLQNPTLRHDLALLAVDGTAGFGNARLLPAGPLRESFARAAPRLGAAIVIGEDRAFVERFVRSRLPVIRAQIEPPPAAPDWRGRRALAFAGIGRPGKFFDSLNRAGAQLVDTIGFPDHHPYRAREIERLLDEAQRARAVAITTAKDWVRLPREFGREIAVFDVEIAWATSEDRERITALLRRTIHSAAPDGSAP